MAQIKDKAKQIQKLKSMGQYGSSVPSSGKKEAFVNLQRQKFFGDRKDVPEERVIRRTRQEGGVDQFKQSLISSGRVLKDSKGNPVMNPNTGEPVYLTDVPGGRTVGDVSRDFAYRFGPTPREIAGDIGYGIKSIGSALGQKFAAGEIGIMGIVKGLYEKFTNSAKQAKDYLGQKVDKLSDIDLEFLKGDYKLMSNKQSVQEAKQAEALSKLADQNLAKLTPYKNLFGDYYTYGGSSMPGQVTIEEQVSTPVTSKVGGADLSSAVSFTYPGNKFGSTAVPNNIQQARTVEELKNALKNVPVPEYWNKEKPYLQQQDDYYYQDKERFSPQSNQYLYADASQSDIDRINKMRQLKSMDPQSIYDMKDVFQLSPDLTLDEIQKIKEGTITQPTGQYAANGGMIEKRLGDLQKKTNNIYGTGILSVR